METAQSSDQTDSVNGLYTLPLEIVVSAPRIPPWLLYIPGAQLLNTINTTHWGVKVGDSYHDLKMQGLFHTKPGAAFAASLAERDERPASRTIPIGHTHLTPDEVKMFVRHRLAHASWYNFWYENCQHFAISHIATNIRCPNNESNDSDAAEEENLIGLDEVSMQRHTDYFPLSTHILRNIVAPLRGKRSLSGLLLTQLFCCGIFFLVGKALREEELAAREEATLFEQESSEIPPANSVRQDRGNDYNSWQALVAEWKNPPAQFERPTTLADADWPMALFTFLLILNLFGYLTLEAFGFSSIIVAVWLALCYRALIVKYVVKVIWKLSEAPESVPWNLSRKGRSPVREPCQHCSSLRNAVHSRGTRCVELDCRKPTLLPLSSFAKQWLQSSFKQKILLLWSEQPEDATDVMLRSLIPFAVYVMTIGSSFLKQVEYVLMTHLILSFAAPATGYGMFMASIATMANMFWALIVLLYGLYNDGGYFIDNYWPLGMPKVGLNGFVFWISLGLTLPAAFLSVPGPWGWSSSD